MKKVLFILWAITILPLAGFAQELIERIDIVGNERITRETVMFYLSSREGDYYNPEVLKKDFRVLWSLGFFSNIMIEESDGARGKIVKITVEETPLIKTVVYKTGRKVKEDDITNKLKEKDEYLLPYSNYSPAKVQKIRKTIEDLLAEKGLGAAQVAVETAKKGKNEVELTFRIDEGPKVRVGEVVFAGSPKLGSSALSEALKENKKHSFVTWIAGKDSFKQAKLGDDVAAIKKKLQESGYMEATVGDPKVEEVERRTFWPFSKKRKMIRLTFPVNAGYLYKVGEVKVEGNKFFTAAGIMSKIKFEKGEIYSTKVREKSVEDLGELFRQFGYWYAQAVPVENLDPKNKAVNVVYQIYEGDICFLRRLEIKGNVYTKDKVIRREIMVDEGGYFSLSYFKDSILRIKQLGLVDLEKEPEIKPDPKEPTQFDVTLNVKELQRNNIQFTAGYSGYEGTFIALSYSTVNFLGAGENLEFTAQYGKRIRNYSFGFTEPYVFDYPVSLGFNVYDRYMVYPYIYNRKGQGVDFTVSGRLLGNWLRGSLTYSFENIEITQPESLTTQEYAGLYGMTTPYYDPYYQGLWGFGKYKMSSLYPTIYRSTVDSPLTPSSGTLILASLKFAGQWLGGEIDLYKPRFEFTHYRPIIRGPRFHSLGFHVEYSFVKPLGDSAVPFWERFFLGGERSIRGYEIYTIGPRSSEGQAIGGLKELVINAEYIWAVGGPLYLILFHDRGNAWELNQKVSLKDVYTSTGIEARIFVPALRVPFRLIFAYNNRLIYKDDTKFAFRFAIGTTF
jgi:outer membrane protein insertion porin family